MITKPVTITFSKEQAQHISDALHTLNMIIDHQLHKEIMLGITDHQYAEDYKKHIATTIKQLKGK